MSEAHPPVLLDLVELLVRIGGSPVECRLPSGMFATATTLCACAICGVMSQPSRTRMRQGRRTWVVGVELAAEIFQRIPTPLSRLSDIELAFGNHIDDPTSQRLSKSEKRRDGHGGLGNRLYYVHIPRVIGV
jgi:hypothetical protein